MSISGVGSNNFYSNYGVDIATRELTDVLMKYGHDQYHTPLWKAIIEDDLQAVRVLLKNGYNPDEKSMGYYPLCATFYKKNLDILNVLLSHGANPFLLGQGSGDEVRSCMFNAIVGYCHSIKEEDILFYRQVVDAFIKNHSNLKDPIVCLNGKKYSAREICSNLNLTQNPVPGNALAIPETKRYRASELAALFISKGG